MKRTILFAAFLICCLSAALAQSPEGINYQSVIRDSDGIIIQDRLISMRISLCTGSTEGDQIYSETHQVETNEFGLISLSIGSGNSGQNFQEIDWGINNNIWIRIELDKNGGSNFQLMGGMKVLSVPYSFFANKAGFAQPMLRNLTDSERQNLLNPDPGLMILNSTTNKINVYMADGWYELGGEKVGDSFSCGRNLVDDRDQQAYKTIQIGDQCWMAENLNVGEMIIGNIEMTDNDIIEKYCYNDSVANCEIYGGLYQWDEMMLYVKNEGTVGICPTGWHIPSDVEVQQLEMALGMDATSAGLTNIWRGSGEGTKMAMGGDSGYDALFGGRRVTGGLYSAKGDYEYLYTSSESGSNAWRRCLRVADPRIGRYNTFPKTYGMSVRCVMD